MNSRSPDTVFAPENILPFRVAALAPSGTNRTLFRLAIAIEMGIIAALLFVGWAFAERYASDALTYKVMLTGTFLLAFGELARVPLALAAARSTSWVRRTCLLVVLLMCVLVSAKGIAQVAEQMFHPRLVEVTEARMNVNRNEAELAASRTKAELPSQELERYDERIAMASEALKSLAGNLNTIGARPKAQPIYRRNAKGKSYLAGHTTPAWDGFKTQSQVAEAQDMLDRLIKERAALETENLQQVSGILERERALDAAKARLEQTLLHSQLHSFTGMMVGKAAVDVSDGELNRLMFWFIVVASFGTALSATALAYGSVTRAPKSLPAPVQPVLKIVPDIRAAMRAL